jgi:hypothetical protein
MTELIELTLRQGLWQFYASNKGQLSHNKAGLPDEVKSFFRSHDIAHVLFTCDISLVGEGAVKIGTIFGTTSQHIKRPVPLNYLEILVLPIFAPILESCSSGFPPLFTVLPS